MTPDITLDSIAYDILTRMKGGATTDGSQISIRQIKYAIRQARALLIRRDGAKGRLMQDMEQKIAVPMTRTAGVLKSTAPIPTPVRLQGDFALTFVGEGNLHYPMTTYGQSRYLDKAPVSASRTRTWIQDGYLHCNKSASSLTLTVRGLFEDPVEAYEYGGLVWDDAVTPYPVSADLLPSLSSTVLDILQPILKTVPETATDGRDDR